MQSNKNETWRISTVVQFDSNVAEQYDQCAFIHIASKSNLNTQNLIKRKKKVTSSACYDINFEPKSFSWVGLGKIFNSSNTHGSEITSYSPLKSHISIFQFQIPDIFIFILQCFQRFRIVLEYWWKMWTVPYSTHLCIQFYQILAKKQKNLTFQIKLQ